MRIHRIGIGVLAVAIAVGLHATPSDAGAVRIQTYIAKDKSGPFNSASVKAQLGPGKVKSFYIKVSNNTPKDTLAISMTAQSANELGYTQKWFRNRNNITSDVKGAGFDFDLTPGQAKKFRLKLKANDSSPNEYCSRTALEDTGLGTFDYALVRLNGAELCPV